MSRLYHGWVLQNVDFVVVGFHGVEMGVGFLSMFAAREIVRYLLTFSYPLIFLINMSGFYLNF